MATQTPPGWAPHQATETYNIPDWGEGYFGVTGEGRLAAYPRADAGGPAVDLYRLADELRAAGLAPPVLVRFGDILRHRTESLIEAFRGARADHGYGGGYTAVYPIKVNQQANVVRQVLAHGGGEVGLEAGSKPELMAVLALANAERPTIICNGYKDREYVRLALIGRRLGHRPTIVVEKPSELDWVVRESRAMGIEPLLGVRLRLASIGKGKWQNTGGERSKFGLTPGEVLALVARLEAEGLGHCLHLMHFHLGSQLANIRDIQAGLKEAARYYGELRGLGVPLADVDVGGGLGVDYEGTSCRSFCSMNYDLREYANNVVHALWEACEAEGLPHPNLLTESGRAMTAHHAMLVTEVVDVARAPGRAPAPAAEGEEPLVVQDLRRALGDLSRRNAVESYHDATHWLAEAQAMFNHGILDLPRRALAETLYAGVCQRVRGLLNPESRGHREILDDLEERFADKYICNLSLFQSLPDIWAIDQIFPVVPLHRLDEPPERSGILHDLTCDSDGQVEHYVGRDGVASTLPLHPPRAGERYLLGVFLVGAYQEILGDIHNLFGDTHSVNVELTGDGGHRISEPAEGESVSDVLATVGYRADDLFAAYLARAREAGLPPAEAQAYLGELRQGLAGYTYLED